MENKTRLIDIMNAQEKKCVGFGKDPLHDVLSSFMAARNNSIKKYGIIKKNADVIPLPDFSDLAEEHFFESLPPLYKFVVDIALTMLQSDEKRYKQLSKINNMINYNAEHPEERYMIIQMGIRDALSVDCQMSKSKTRTVKTASVKNIAAYSHKALHYWRKHDKERALYYLGCAIKHLEDTVIKKSDMGINRLKQFSMTKPSSTHNSFFKRLGDTHGLHHHTNRVMVQCKACTTKVIPGLLPMESNDKNLSLEEWISNFVKMFNSINAKHSCSCGGRLQHKHYYGPLHDAAKLTAAFLVMFFKEAELL